MKKTHNKEEVPAYQKRLSLSPDQLVFLELESQMHLSGATTSFTRYEAAAIIRGERDFNTPASFFF
jgi:hypothetical protein